MREITLPEKPMIIKQEGNTAVFEIKSCYPGYGMTLGNSLRRVLFSSLPGSAITAVKISGVSHEFSTIPGIIEDVIELTLNLKQVRFKLYSDGPVKLTLKASKEGEVKASQIKATNDIEIVNKDAHIATITDKNTKLEIEMQIEKGIGYVIPDQKSEEKLEIGNIALDAVFTPVKKVNYKVENMRVGKMTNYDRLILEIETDGSITPQEAFKKAASLLVDHFKLLKEDLEKIEEKTKLEEGKEKTTEERKKDTSKTPIEELNLPLRILHILKDNKIKTTGKLARKSEKDLEKIEGMGNKGIEDIKKSLGKIGLTLKNKS